MADCKKPVHQFLRSKRIYSVGRVQTFCRKYGIYEDALDANQNPRQAILNSGLTPAAIMAYAARQNGKQASLESRATSVAVPGPPELEIDIDQSLTEAQVSPVDPMELEIVEPSPVLVPAFPTAPMDLGNSAQPSREESPTKRQVQGDKPTQSNSEISAGSSKPSRRQSVCKRQRIAEDDASALSPLEVPSADNGNAVAPNPTVALPPVPTLATLEKVDRLAEICWKVCRVVRGKK